MKKSCKTCYYYRQTVEYLQQPRCRYFDETLIKLNGKKLTSCKNYLNADEMRKLKEMRNEK